MHTLTDSSTVVGGESGQITYGYDAVGDTTQITDENAAGSSGITAKHVELAYNPDGSPDTITRYNSATVQPADVVATTEYRTTAGLSTPGSGYDADGRLVAMQQTFGSTTQPYTWQYDAAANITQEVSSDGTDNYALDSADQLKTASLNTEGYSYDQNGNRVGGGYVTGANNEFLSDGTYKYTYDKDGNLIKRTRIFDAGWWISDYETDYTWDYENRLISVTYKNDTGLITKSIICGCDFAGRLISTATQSVSGGGFSYEYSVYDGSNELLAFSDSTALGGSGTPSLLRRDLYGPAVDQILATDDYHGGVLWGLADQEGTVREVVNNSGGAVNHVQFNSFGKPINSTAPLAGFPFGLDGMPYNATTGLYQTETVAYDPFNRATPEPGSDRLRLRHDESHGLRRQ